MRHVLEQGLSARSACVVCSVRDGHLCADVLPAKWCLPALDDRGCVVSLEVRYKFDLDGELHWYRRTITAEADTVYEPVPVSDRVLPSVVKQSFLKARKRTESGVTSYSAVTRWRPPSPTMRLSAGRT